MSIAMDNTIKELKLRLNKNNNIFKSNETVNDDEERYI